MKNVLEVPEIKPAAGSMMNNFIQLDSILESNQDFVKQEFGMSRQQFRKMKRDHTRTSDILKSLTPKQKDTVQLMLTSTERYYQERLKEVLAAQTSAINAALGDTLSEYSSNVGQAFWDEVNELFLEHLEKTKGKFMSEKEIREMDTSIKELVFRALDNGVVAKEIRANIAFKYPAMSKAQVKNVFNEAKEEWNAINSIYEAIEKKPSKKGNVEKEPVTITPKAIKQLDEIISGSKETKVAKGPIEVKEPKNEIKSNEAISITEQLKCKLDLFITKKAELENDIKSFQRQIKELEAAIEAKNKDISGIEAKTKNVQQMIELAKDIE